MKVIYFRIFSILTIVVLGVIDYLDSFSCSFHFDDFFFIIDAPFIRDISNLKAIWDYWPCRFMTFFSFAFNYHFYQFNVFGYHLFNVIVHLLSAILVFWFVLLTFYTPAIRGQQVSRHAYVLSLLAGLIFVSHPIQIQAVTNIWQRAASMTALFYLAAVCFYVKSRLYNSERSVSKCGVTFYLLSIIAAIMAMFTKEIAITLPLIIVFYEYSFFKIGKGFNWRPLIPFIFISLIIPLTFLFVKSENSQSSHSFVNNITSVQYLLTEFRVILTYIRLAFLPIHQNLDYDYSISKSILEFPTAFSLLILIGILTVAKRMFLKYRLISFSIFWFFLTLIPESSFFPFGDVIFEHRLYLPMVGFSLFLISSMYYVIGRKSFGMMVIILTGMVIINSILTYQRNKIWENDFTLWNDVVQKSPNKLRPHVNFGKAYLEQGDYLGAIVELNKAINLAPDYSIIYFNRGNLYDQLGNFDQAMADYNEAIKLNPNFIQTYINRGLLYAGHGDFIRSLLDCNKAIEIDPHRVDLFYNRMSIYFRLKEYNKVWEDVYQIKKMGQVINPKFIDKLKLLSDKQL